MYSTNDCVNDCCGHDFHCVHCGHGDCFEVGMGGSCENCGKYPHRIETARKLTDEELEESEASWQVNFIKPIMVKRMLDRLVSLGEITQVYHPTMEMSTYFWKSTGEPLSDLE